MEKESIQTLTEPITGGIYLQDLYVLQHGKMMLYTVASGVPCIFNAYNITDRRLEMTAPLPGTQNCWSIGADHHGNVYIAPQDTAKLFRMSPMEGIVFADDADGFQKNPSFLKKFPVRA